MAKKGQKFDSYTEEFKLKLYYEYKNGNLGGYRQVAKKYNISPFTLKNWITKMRKYGTVKNDIYKKRGHNKNPVTLEDYKERYEILKKYQAFLKAQREKK